MISIPADEFRRLLNDIQAYLDNPTLPTLTMSPGSMGNSMSCGQRLARKNDQGYKIIVP
jgi:hypothetical protein